MSRRESRVSINERQNDALFEFENCISLPLSPTSHASLSLPILSYSQEEVPSRQQTYHKVRSYPPSLRSL